MSTIFIDVEKDLRKKIKDVEKEWGVTIFSASYVRGAKYMMIEMNAIPPTNADAKPTPTAISQDKEPPSDSE